MNKIILTLLFSLLSQTLLPQIIYRQGYYAEFDTINYCTAYASWTLTAKRISHKGNRLHFLSDTIYNKYVLSTSLYTNSNYDRGHLSSSADNQVNNQCLKDSYKLLNIVPQAPRLNRGVWKSLEDSCRAWSLNNDSIVIIAGCIFNNNKIKIKNKITIPNYMYKIIIFYPTRQILYFLFKNTLNEKYSKNIWDYQTTKQKLLQLLKYENIKPKIY